MGRTAVTHGGVHSTHEPVSSPRRPVEPEETDVPKKSVIAAVAGLALAGAAVPTPPSADAAASLGDRVLRLHSRGRDVRQLQRALDAMQISMSADGQFGRRTAAGVRRYERAHKMEADGRVSRRQGRGIARRAAALKADRTPAQAPPTEVAGVTAELSADGRTALAPAAAPEPVKAAIAAANAIVGKPYRYGGGHGDFEDSAYDCSGAVSYALHGAGLLKHPVASGDLMRWGVKGKGEWITVYAHGGHTYVLIAGLRFDTSGSGGKGPRWRTESRSPRGFAVRHATGL